MIFVKARRVLTGTGKGLCTSMLVNYIIFACSYHYLLCEDD